MDVMNFFEHQARAHTNSKRLIILFTLAVIAIVCAVYFPIQWAWYTYILENKVSHKDNSIIWNFSLFWTVAAGTLAVIFIGSIYKIKQLSEGGCIIAHMMGGKLVEPETKDFKERQLFNVVEEMSIAAGIPVPNIYLLHNEFSINAFAAGYTMGDAVIGVTKGTIEKLNREELQGVIAHEFSHILNGDMRLNIKLMGLLHGILVIGLIGRAMISGTGRRHGKRDSGGPLIAIGLALMVIGWIGFFFGRLIQAAVSRQREFLADASAVQYTRNADGIGNALKKIAGYGGIPAAGSNLLTSNREEISHMTFGQVNTSRGFGWTSSHPPIEKRIMAIDRGFNPEREKKINSLPNIVDKFPEKGFTPQRSFQMGDATMQVSSKIKYTADMVPSLVGMIPVTAIDSQRQWLDQMDIRLRQACHHPINARAIVFCLMTEFNDEKHRTFAKMLELRDPHALPAFQELCQPIKNLGMDSRLKLIDLSLPALRSLSQEDYQTFVRTMVDLISEDQHMSLFEFLVMKTVRRHLKNHRKPQKSPTPTIRDIRKVEAELNLLLSSIQSPDSLSIQGLDAALKKLLLTTFEVRKKIIEACAQAILADQHVAAKEREILRAIGDTLDCPIPYLGVTEKA